MYKRLVVSITYSRWPYLLKRLSFLSIPSNYDLRILSENRHAIVSPFHVLWPYCHKLSRKLRNSLANARRRSVFVRLHSCPGLLGFPQLCIESKNSLMINLEASDHR